MIHMSRLKGICAAVLGTAVLCGAAAPEVQRVAEAVAATGPEAVTPLPQPPPVPRAMTELGRKLFHDVRLSGNAQMSCASCHRLDRGGGDGRTRPLGSDGRPLDFNAPTVFNAALNFRLNWRGNFRTLEELAEAALLDARLMNTSWSEVVGKLQADADYVRSFGEAYGSQPDRAHVLDALASFQRGLATPNARFDEYLRGARDAITAEEERGFQLFKTYGCVACHQGMNLGGNLFQKFGIFYEQAAQRAAPTHADLGRFGITGRKSDRQVFRVPSLRNVAVTAPYFHDGRSSSLHEAVAIMARSQLGRNIPPRDIDAIVGFLATLTGTYDGRRLTPDVDAQ
jgi:cytochrome c peroxidase